MRRLKQYLAGRREAFTTFDVSQLSTVINILRENGIGYNTLSRYTGSVSRRAGSLRSFFEDTECQTQYYVYVAKADAECARYLIRENYKGE